MLLPEARDDRRMLSLRKSSQAGHARVIVSSAPPKMFDRVRSRRSFRPPSHSGDSCQFGGNPDCASCGCIASMALGAVAAHRWGGIVPVGALFRASVKLGRLCERRAGGPKTGSGAFPILPMAGPQ
jgi:hypothetical protein